MRQKKDETEEQREQGVKGVQERRKDGEGVACREKDEGKIRENATTKPRRIYSNDS